MTSFAVLWIIFTSFLLLFGGHAKPNERICWFAKRTRAGESCQGRLRRFDEAIARFVEGNLKCWACTRHWMRASREANEYCSSPLLEHSTELSKRKVPRRFYRLFDRLGAHVPTYRPGTRWCNKCSTIADSVFSKEPDYVPPTEVSEDKGLFSSNATYIHIIIVKALIFDAPENEISVPRSPHMHTK